MFVRFVASLFFLQAVFCDSVTFTLSENQDSDTRPITISADGYNGVFTGQLIPLKYHGLSLCANWLVAAEAPLVDLAAYWSQVCEFSVNISSNSEGTPFTFTFPLRSGIYYFSLALILSSDTDSTGQNDVFTVDLDYSSGTCLAGEYGPLCSSYAPLLFGKATPSVAGIQHFHLPSKPNTPSTTQTKFVKNFRFQFSGAQSGDKLYYRLNAPVILNSTIDGTCSDLNNCYITTPPMTNVDGIFWDIYLSNKNNVSLTVTSTDCPSNKLGKDCKDTYQTITDHDIHTHYGSAYYVFSAPVLSIAVGGLDGYDQTDVAPPISVQVDSVPNYLPLASSISAEVNRLNIDLTGVVTNASQFVVFVNTKSSFGIWIPTNDQCALNCSTRGSCDDYVCNCNNAKKYNGLGCEHEIKNFTIEYVILISVGGLLVLSIVIGVPIYCWMNRHSEYETVA